MGRKYETTWPSTWQEEEVSELKIYSVIFMSFVIVIKYGQSAGIMDSYFNNFSTAVFSK